MKLPPQSPQPPVSLVEEWGNPAMTEFKRQEAEDRVTFGQSHTQEEWRAALDQSLMTATRLLRQIEDCEAGRHPFRVPLPADEITSLCDSLRRHLG